VKDTLSDQITWVYTKNPAQAFRFYQDVLGLPLDRDAGSARLYLTGPSSLIGLCEVFADRAVEPKGGMITLIIDDTDGVGPWYERLKVKGADLLGPPKKTARFGIYGFSSAIQMGI